MRKAKYLLAISGNPSLGIRPIGDTMVAHHFLETRISGVGMLTFMVHRSLYAADRYGAGCGRRHSWYIDHGTLQIGMGMGGDVNLHGTSIMVRCR